MSNRTAERRLSRPLRIDVDELMVERRIGEGVYPILINLQPLAGFGILADAALRLFVGLLGVRAHVVAISSMVAGWFNWFVYCRLNCFLVLGYSPINKVSVAGVGPVTLCRTELRIATRRSPLAMWQANHVAQLLCQVEPTLDIVMVPSDTFADLDLKRSISDLGGKGAFSKEIQQVVLEGHADLAVHSAKDLQAVTPDGLTVAAYPTRGDARDALVGITIDQLQDRMAAASAQELGVVGAATPLIASGSNRRRALLLDLCPNIDFTELRGNIATRLSRLEGARHEGIDESEDVSNPDGLVMANAALERLHIEPEIVEVLDPEVFVPQVGQGALAVEVRADDTPANKELRALVAEIDDPVTRLAVEAERSFLAELGGDCTLPAGAHATVAAVGRRIELTIRGILADDNGENLQRLVESGSIEAEPGRILARSLRKALEGVSEAPTS